MLQRSTSCETRTDWYAFSERGDPILNQAENPDGNAVKALTFACAAKILYGFRDRGTKSGDVAQVVRARAS